MKKTALLFCSFLLLMSTNLFGALIANLKFHPDFGTSVVAYPNSTLYPGSYEVRISVSAYSNTMCSGVFTLELERRNITTNMSEPWGSVWPDSFFPNLGVVQSYSGSCMTYQPQGMKYEYRVKVTFDPAGNFGTTCGILPNEVQYTNVGTVEVKPKAVPDFTVNTTPIPADDSPIVVCGGTVKINAAITANETKYFLSVSESNRWWFRTGNYEWGRWFSGTAPDNIRLQDILFQYTADFTAPTPAQVQSSPSLIILNGGTLQSPPAFQGQERYYRVSICTGEPEWDCKTALIRIDNTLCRMTVVEIADMDLAETFLSEESTSGVKVFPNPVKDIMHIATKEKIEGYTIYDITNTIIKTEKNSKVSDLQQLDLSGLKQGLYIIELVTGKGIQRHKIVKE